jgi:drug/metabolite transporter (DMT)-like permease
VTDPARTPVVTPLSRGRVYGLVVLGLVGVSSSGVLAAIVIGDGGDPRLGITTALWRCAAGGAALVPWALRARATHPLTPGDRRRLHVAGGFLAAHFGLFLASIALTSVASATTFSTTTAVFVAIGAIAYLGEHPDRRTWTGIVVTVVGAVAIAAGDLGAEDLGPRALLGDALAFAAAAFGAGYLLIARRVRTRVHAATFSSVVYLSAAAVLLVVAALIDAPLVELTGTQWLAIAGMVAGPQLLGHNVYTTLLSSVPATVIGVVVLAEPVLATLLAWGVLGQLPAPTYWIGAPVVLLGVGLATWRRTGPARTQT